MYYQNYLQDELGPSNMSFSCYVYLKSDKGYPNHFHSYLEFIYILEGALVIEKGGVSSYCKAGDLIFIPMLELHQLIGREDAASIMILQLSHSFLGNDINQRLYYIENGEKTIDSNIWHVPKGSRVEYFLKFLIDNCDHVPPSLCVRSQEVLTQKDIEKICILKGSAMILIGALLQESVLAIGDWKVRDGKIRDAEQLQKVFHRVSTCPEQPISMQEAAKMSGMSYYSFCRAFKQLLGYNFIEYQNIMRVRYAEDLLLSTEMTITEISEKANFGTISYFNRTFKKYNSMTPSAFRKQRIAQKETIILQN